MTEFLKIYNKALGEMFENNDNDDYEDNKIYGVKVYAFDRAIRPKKESEIHKHIVSTGSNKIKKTASRINLLAVFSWS